MQILTNYGMKTRHPGKSGHSHFLTNPENAMSSYFNGIYSDTSVFITGHTGFKGSWLSFWLQQLGARLTGYARMPNTDPNHFDILKPDMISITGDLLDSELLTESMRRTAPSIIYHLAAQPIVRDSYSDPVETYRSNVIGTLNVLEAARQTPSVKAVVIITTDKVYENREWEWGYRENDRLGGYDPYSSSKACAEILCASYRNSFWNPDTYGCGHDVLMATVRAGNVIGGGDWSKDRLIPDIMKATARGTATVIRNPHSTRPWQHVLDCLSGYLCVGEQLLSGNKRFADAYNFGPPKSDNLAVGDICKRVQTCWPEAMFEFPEIKNQPHEAGALQLDCSKAGMRLRWKPVWNAGKAVTSTTKWYRYYYEYHTVETGNDLINYLHDAEAAEVLWTQPS